MIRRRMALFAISLSKNEALGMSPLPLLTKALDLPSDQDASGRTLGDDELRCLAAAIESGTLTSTKGRFVRTLEERFASWTGTRFAYATTSGTAALHVAIAALDTEPGDEIVTSPITDMGAIAPILYQGAIPVFADVDPRTANVTAATIAAVLSPRTRAIVVTHLFGNPAEMSAIARLAEQHGIAVIEDCAQAFGARHAGTRVGCFGAIGCFSLQQGKHITTGEGGIVVTDDPALARRMYLFINKAWGYGDPKPDHYFLALNYRMSELQGAVAVGQLPKLDGIVARRIALANDFTHRLDGLSGIHAPYVADGDTHSYWKYALRIDSAVHPNGAVRLAKALAGRGIPSAPRYIQKPAFECEVIRDQRTFGTSRWPFTLARPDAVAYGRERYPGTYHALDEVLVLPWNDRYTEEHVAHLAEAVASGLDSLAALETA
jgi:perosamine synthetase